MKNPRRSSFAVGALCLVQFVDVLGVTVVVTALPAMLRGVGAASSSAPLIVTGYAMFFGGLLLLGARLGDRYGHRRILLVGLVSFAVGSVVAATATSALVLVAGRCVQGIAAAFSVPSALRLLLVAAPDDDARRRALAGWSATGALAGASGFLLGGALTDVAGWRAVFAVNVPLAVGLGVAVSACAPRPAGDRSGRLDVAGATTLTAAVMAAVYGASLLERTDRRLTGLVLLVTAAALVRLLVVIERRAAAPLIPAAAVRHPRLRVGAGAAGLNTATTSSAMTLATLYLQDTQGASPTTAGLLLLPCSICVVIGSAAAAPLLRRWSARTGIAMGLAVIGVGVACLLAVPLAEMLLPVGAAIAGAGLGVSSVAANALGTDVPHALEGTASGVLNTAAQLGTALGVTSLLLVASTAGRSLGWACAAAMAVTAAAVLARRVGTHTHPALAATDEPML